MKVSAKTDPEHGRIFGARLDVYRDDAAALADIVAAAAESYAPNPSPARDRVIAQLAAVCEGLGAARLILPPKGATVTWTTTAAMFREGGGTA